MATVNHISTVTMHSTLPCEDKHLKQQELRTHHALTQKQACRLFTALCDSPSTSSRLLRIDPTSEEATSVKRPFSSAATLSTISTTLPNVALIRPPMTSPKRRPRSSVTSPRMSARGISAAKFCRAVKQQRRCCHPHCTWSTASYGLVMARLGNRDCWSPFAAQRTGHAMPCHALQAWNR